MTTARELDRRYSCFDCERDDITIDETHVHPDYHLRTHTACGSFTKLVPQSNRHPSHKWHQDDEGITTCTGCDCFPYDAEAREPCVEAA